MRDRQFSLYRYTLCYLHKIDYFPLKIYLHSAATRNPTVLYTPCPRRPSPRNVALQLLAFAYHDPPRMAFTGLPRSAPLAAVLLGRFPNTPGIASSVVALRQLYITMLRRNGDLSAGRKETERLEGMLEILFYASETPDTVKELFLLMQLERLERLTDRKQSNAFEMLFSKIQRYLKEYHGIKLKEFQKKLNQLSL